MKVRSWVAAIAAACAVLLPMVSVLINLYSDVETIKQTKADTERVLELQLDFTRQMVRNTTVLENLDITLKEFGRRLDNYGKQY